MLLQIGAADGCEAWEACQSVCGDIAGILILPRYVVQSGRLGWWQDSKHTPSPQSKKFPPCLAHFPQLLHLPPHLPPSYTLNPES